MSDIPTTMSTDGQHVLFKLDGADGCTRVCENEIFRWLDFGTEYIQSAMNRKTPQQLVLQYTQAMSLALTLSQNTRSVLNLGAGCGAFERYVRFYHPQIDITSVEANPLISDIAKKHFSLPDDQKIITTTAESYLESTKNTLYDIVFCDLHNGEKNPASLHSENFFRNTSGLMSKNAVFAINLLPRNAQELQRVLKTLRRVFKWQYLLEFADIGNIIVFTSMQKPTEKESIRKHASGYSDSNGIDYGQFIDRLLLLPEAPTT